MKSISDTDSLVQHEGGDAHSYNRSQPFQVRIPPEWTDSLEEAQYILSKIQTRSKELNSLQNKHLLKPTFDDSMDEESKIDTLTQDITKVYLKVLYPFLNLTKNLFWDSCVDV